MIYFYETQTYKTHLEEEIGLSDHINSKIDDLRFRREIKKGDISPKCYDPGKGIFVLKIRGKGKNSRIILQEIFDHGCEGHQLFLIRDYIPKKDYVPYWKTRMLPLIMNGKYLSIHSPQEEEYQAAIEWINREVNKPLPPKPALPELMHRWVQKFGVIQNFTVYESANWADKQHLINRYMSDVYGLVKSIQLDKVHDKTDLGIPNRKVFKVSNDEVTVIYVDIAMKMCQA